MIPDRVRKRASRWTSRDAESGNEGDDDAGSSEIEGGDGEENQEI